MESAGNYLFQIIIPLLGIVGLIVVLGYLGKHFNLARPQDNGPIKVIASSALTGQVKLCLVEVGDQQLLISVAGQQVTCLHTLPEKLPENATAAPEFSVYLQKLINRNPA